MRKQAQIPLGNTKTFTLWLGEGGNLKVHMDSPSPMVNALVYAIVTVDVSAQVILTVSSPRPSASAFPN